MWRCLVSGARIMIRSAQAETSAGVPTCSPSSCAFCRDFEPSGRPMRTSTPESRSGSDGAGTAADGHHPGLHHLPDPEWLEVLEQRAELLDGAGGFDGEGLWRH